MTRIEQITYAVKMLNAVYGRGDVRKVRVFASGRIEFDCHPFGMRTETRIGRIKNDTVYALGHQRKLI